MNELQDKIGNVMAIVFGVSRDAITEGSSPDTIEGWDSIGHLNLAVALEEEFEIKLTEEDILELMSFKLIEIKIKEKLN